MKTVTKADRIAHKAQGGAPVVKKAGPGPIAKKEEVKREPQRSFKMNTHYIEYFGKEILKFTEEEVSSSIGFALIKCKDTSVVIPTKCKTVMLENC